MKKKRMNLRRRSLRSGQNKGDDGIKVNDFISKMPDDVLVMILTCLPIKHAVVTSGLSTRWRFLWRNVTRLDFDGTETLNTMVKGEKRTERNKFINQVNQVIHSYEHPNVQSFKIRFDLTYRYSEDIDEWVQFALDKKVENLEIDLRDESYLIRDVIDKNYNFVLPSSIAMAGKMLSLKKLSLLGVCLNAPTLNEILKNSPHLTVLDMYESYLFPHIDVGGCDIKLLHLKLVACYGIESISLYGFDLVSFVHGGSEIEFYLSDLPKLKELYLGDISVGLENNVFSQISSCALYLQVLIMDIGSPMRGLNVNSIIKLPNVKKLFLSMGAEEDDSLLEFTSIAQACPRLETFAISLHWGGLMKIRKKVRRVVTPHRHEHLKLLEMFGYYGRISDLELAVYVIENAAALKKIVIDPCCDAYYGNLTEEETLKREKAGRSSARRQLTPILPPGVDLDIKSQRSNTSVTVGVC